MLACLLCLDVLGRLALDQFSQFFEPIEVWLAFPVFLVCVIEQRSLASAHGNEGKNQILLMFWCLVESGIDGTRDALLAGGTIRISSLPFLPLRGNKMLGLRIWVRHTICVLYCLPLGNLNPRLALVSRRAGAEVNR